MELHEYLDTLTEQIRCKKARPMVQEEIKNHIEDQAQAYRKEGMGEDQAMTKAILEMGDPVEAGMELDRVHRPKMQWTLVALVILLSIIGMIMQIVIFKTGCLSNEENITTVRDEFIYGSILNTIISFCVIGAVCILDYTYLAKHPVALWWLFSFLQVLGAFYMGGSYMRGYQINYYMITLMVPVFAAVVFQYKNKGMAGFLKCIGLYLALVIIKMFTQTAFISGMLELTISVLVILTVAVIRGWFGEKKAGKLALVWIPAIGFPVLIGTVALFFNDNLRILAEYQAARIQALLHMGNNTMNYQLLAARAEMEKATLFGSGELPLTTLPSIQNDYIITSMFTYFGIIFTLLVLGMILFFIWKAFHLSIKQKNQFGSIISIGCVIALAVKVVVYVIPNVGGVSVFGQMSMPFLSYGLGNAVVNGVLVGLLLSVYRNTDIVSEKVSKPKYIFRLPIEKV